MVKYNKLSAVQVALLKKNIVDILGEIDNDMAWYVREALVRLELKGSPDIEVRITCNGGSIKIGLDIYDALRFYKGKKTGIALGHANSMGGIILQACDTRKSTEHACHVIHHAISEKKFSLTTLLDEEKMKFEREQMQKSSNYMISIIARRTGKSLNEIDKKCAEDKAMTPQEAFDFGLIDEII